MEPDAPEISESDRVIEYWKRKTRLEAITPYDRKDLEAALRAFSFEETILIIDHELSNKKRRQWYDEHPDKLRLSTVFHPNKFAHYQKLTDQLTAARLREGSEKFSFTPQTEIIGCRDCGFKGFIWAKRDGTTYCFRCRECIANGRYPKIPLWGQRYIDKGYEPIMEFILNPELVPAPNA